MPLAAARLSDVAKDASLNPRSRTFTPLATVPLVARDDASLNARSQAFKDPDGT